MKLKILLGGVLLASVSHAAQCPMDATDVSLMNADLESLFAVDKTKDSDGDGLSDWYEKQINTNPNRVDSDFDGIPDNWEVSHGLNPTYSFDASFDPDGDGANNLAEFKIDTDPYDKESNPQQKTAAMLVPIINYILN